MKSILTQSALDALCEKFHILDTVHPELPSPNDRIRNSPTGLSFRDPVPRPWFCSDRRKFSEPFLCFVGISWYYDLDVNCYPTFWTDDDEEMDLFAFINHADPTKVQIEEREVGEGEIDHAIQDEMVNIFRVEDEIQAIVAEKPKVQKKRKIADSASGSNHPPNKLWEDHGTSGHVGASIGGKSLAAIQELFEKSTLNVKVGVTAAATVPFVTSSMTPTLELLCAIASLMTVAIATTVIVGAISAMIYGVGVEPVPRRILRDSASPSTAEAGIAGPSQPAGLKTSLDTFFVSQDLDSETLQQIYVPNWNVINDSALDDLEVCRSIVEQLTPPSQISTVEAVEAAQSSELDGLKERNAALEGRVA
nr:hypothetical protein CTI12_AA620880 [Tanacetum cinerariifolium]